MARASRWRGSAWAYFCPAWITWSREVVTAPGGVGMVFPNTFIRDGQGLAERRLGVGVVSLVRPINPEACRNSWL